MMAGFSGKRYRVQVQAFWIYLLPMGSRKEFYMRLRIKVKLAATALALAGMFSGIAVTSAGTETGMGVRSIPSDGNSKFVVTNNKTTADKYSNLTLGDITIYGTVQARTYSETSSGAIIGSNPWTDCSANSTVYMGQYITMETYVGQRISLYAKKTSNATQAYTADFTSWDFR